MLIDSLEITQLRNLKFVRLLPHPTTNFIVGRNGSGKTSVLESISILSNGRSFRATDPKKIISRGASELVVFASVLESAGTIPRRLGISKSLDGSTIARIDGLTQRKISSLAILLPFVCIETGSIEIIDGGPNLRRSLMDWGMFHVKHDYLDTWQRYRKVYRQKNALLKSQHQVDKRDLLYWNELLSVEGNIIDSARKQYLQDLNIHFQAICSQYLNIADYVELKYKSGWNQHKFESLICCLKANIDLEVERRSCLYGPHRADLAVHWNEGLAKDICSRGQKKLVLYGVRLAQVALMRERTQRFPVLLLDDLPAELDFNNIENVTRFLTDFPCQTFITAISKQSINETLLSQLKAHSMFHVEHGQLIDIE